MAVESAIWLIRHPEPQVVAGRCCGSLDLELSEAGLRQMDAIVAAMSSEAIAAVYSSPLRRCRRLAEALSAARGCACQVVDGLREIDFGEWEGLTYDEIAARDPDRYRQWMERPWEIRFPSGECLADMRRRVLDTANAVRSLHPGQPVALVTHGGPIRVILAEALRIDEQNLFRIGQSYGGISLVRYWDGVPGVGFINRTVV